MNHNSLDPEEQAILDAFDQGQLEPVQRCLAHDLWDYISAQLNMTLSNISIKNIIDKLNLSDSH